MTLKLGTEPRFLLACLPQHVYIFTENDFNNTDPEYSSQPHIKELL